MEWFETIFENVDSAFLNKIVVKGGQCVKKFEFGEMKIFLIYWSLLYLIWFYKLLSISILKWVEIEILLFKPEKAVTQLWF